MDDVQFGLFVGPFRDAAATLPLKTYSGPVQTEYGWHIIRVEKRDVPKFRGREKTMSCTEAENGKGKRGVGQILQ